MTANQGFRFCHGLVSVDAPTYPDGGWVPLRQLADGALVVSVGGGGGVIVVNAQGQYNLVPPVLADGAFAPLQLDVNGNLKNVEQYAPVYEDNTNGVAQTIEKPLVGATYAPNLYNFSFASSGATGAVVKATAGNLYSIRATKSSIFNTQTYLQFFNRTTVPPGGTACLFQFALLPSPLDGTMGPPLLVDHSILTQAGAAFTAGIVWGLSSTSNTFTGVAEDIELFLTYL